MSKAIAGLASIDPKVAIFAMGAWAIVALAGMTLGYEVDISILGADVKLTK